MSQFFINSYTTGMNPSQAKLAKIKPHIARNENRQFLKHTYPLRLFTAQLRACHIILFDFHSLESRMCTFHRILQLGLNKTIVEGVTA